MATGCDRKSLSIASLTISDIYATFLLFYFVPAAAILDDRKSLSIAFLAISDQYALLFFVLTKWLPAASVDDRKSLSIAFLAISDQYALLFLFFLTKWLPAASLDDRKSLSIAFLAILDQYATFLVFVQNGHRRPFWKADLRQKTMGFFHYVLSMAMPKMPNMKLIGEHMTQLETPQAF